MDEFYNDVFAKKVVSIISKMDDDEAEMFLRFSTHSMLMADIEANRRTLDNHTQAVHKSIQADAARVLNRMVSKSADVDYKAIAALIGTISEVRKDRTPYEELYGKPQPRGKGGRWSVSIARENYKAPKEKGPKYKGGANRHENDVMVGPNFNLTQALDRTGGNVSTFADRWHGPVDHEATTNARTYRRIQTGSEALMHAGDPKLKAAGKAGQFFGQYGPEAEKVVGPHLRRTAYRYRGTERRPDTQLIQSANEASRAIMRNEGIEQHDFTPAMRTEASQRAAIGYLNERLPKKKWTKLQQAAGKIPPSEGVIINEDGKIITQAVGSADDHYLPFNLKNLKGLQGGHYVRSRSQGGLTTEDIYTGLVSGARSVTVVSRSGVFTVNFEDDFRGGRRYNDKAAQMVGRYAKTLDAVKSETVDRRPLSPEERAEIRDQVETEYADLDLPRAEIEDMIKDRENEYKSRPTLTKAELADIDALARKDNPGEREQKIARSELISAAMEKKAQRNYQLDGEGYEAAQEALREQFPYYIASVRAIHRGNAQHDNKFSAETDKGYVKPRYIRPEGAKEGWHDTTINGRGKVSADRLNYANWAHNPERRTTQTAPESDKPKEGSPAAKVADQFTVRENIAAGQAKRAANDALFSLAQLMHNRVENVGDIVHTAGASREAFDKVAANAVQRDKLMDELKTAADSIDGVKGAEDVHTKAQAYLTAIDATSAGEAWNGQHAERPSKPFSFDTAGGKQAAYGRSAKKSEIEKEWNKQVLKAAGENARMAIGTLSDEKLADMAASLGYMGHALANGETDRATFAARSAELGADSDQLQRALNAMGSDRGKLLGEQFLGKSEALHRLRALQARYESAPGESHKAPEQLTTDQRTKVSDVAPTDLVAVETALRQDADNAHGNQNVQAVYNSISRSVRALRNGALDKEQFKQDVNDHFDEYDVDYKAEQLIRARLKQLGLE